MTFTETIRRFTGSALRFARRKLAQAHRIAADRRLLLRMNEHQRTDIGLPREPRRRVAYWGPGVWARAAFL